MKRCILDREKAVYDSAYLVCIKLLLLRSLHVKGDLMIGEMSDAQKSVKLCTSILYLDVLILFS